MLSGCREAAGIKRYSKTTGASSEDNERLVDFGYQSMKESEKTKQGKDSILSGLSFLPSIYFSCLFFI